MSTISATSASTSSQGKSPAQLVQIAKDLQALSDALKKNDTKAADAAMLKLQQDSAAAATSSASTASSSVSSSGGTQASSDLAAVASALKAGNLSAAQGAFATFESHAAAAQKAKATASGNASSNPDDQVSDTDSSDHGLSDGSTFSVTV
jgi:hypothetical protein